MAEISKINVNGTTYDILPEVGNNYNVDPKHWDSKKVGKILTPNGETKDLYMMQIMGTGKMSRNSTKITDVAYKSRVSFDLIKARIYKIEGAFTADYGTNGDRYVASIIGMGFNKSDNTRTFLVPDVASDYIGQIDAISGYFYVTIYYYSES